MVTIEATSVEPKRASTPEDMCAPVCAMYASAVPVVYFKLYIHHRFLFAACTSYGAKYERACVDMG